MEYYIKNGRQVIDNNTLAALTLLIAESNPKEKPVIIDLVMNFLNNEWKYDTNIKSDYIVNKYFENIYAINLYQNIGFKKMRIFL